MKLFGYDISDAHVDERQTFDDWAQPLFVKGGEIGCLTMHGLGGTPANVRIVAERLAREGYTVFSPLLPGHGTSVREQSRATGLQWHEAAAAGVKRLRDEGCTKVFVMGLSLGGVLAGLMAEETEIDGACMVCAPVRMRGFLRVSRLIRHLAPFVTYPDPPVADDPESQLRARYTQMYSGFCPRKLQDLKLLCDRLVAGLDRICCPLLLVQAAGDDKVDPVSASIVVRGAVHAPRIDYRFLYHSPHGCTYGPEREAAAEECARFIRSVLDNAPTSRL